VISRSTIVYPSSQGYLKKIAVGSGGMILEMHDSFKNFFTEWTTNRFFSGQTLEVLPLNVLPSFSGTTEAEKAGLQRQLKVSKTEDTLVFKHVAGSG
jgi:hypothetical protein